MCCTRVEHATVYEHLTVLQKCIILSITDQKAFYLRKSRRVEEEWAWQTTIIAAPAQCVQIHCPPIVEELQKVG